MKKLNNQQQFIIPLPFEYRKAVLAQAIDDIKRGQTDSIIKSIYNRHRENSKIKWKAEIKKVVGIPLAKQNGLDI
jgi:hypothetical protein